MQNIQPSVESIKKLFKDNLFVIPEYQRQYSWTNFERMALFEDINKLSIRGDSGSHYLATIVCLEKEKIKLGISEFSKLDVVDGQQRLTTLIILLKSIQLKFDQNSGEERDFAEEIQEMLVKPHSDSLLLLQTNHDSGFYFSNFLKNGEVVDPNEAQEIANREILESINDCQKFVCEWHDEGKSLRLLTGYILNHIFVVLHKISEEKIVYTVFEVLNSRGLEVSWFDRLKSNLMGRAYELEDIDNNQVINELKNTWKDIYSIIGLYKGLDTEILRYAATLYDLSKPSRPLSEKDSVKMFQNRANNVRETNDIAQFLLKVAKACVKLRSNNRINAVTQINQARLLAVTLILRVNLPDTEKDQLLRQWEKVTFRIYGLLRNDARIRVGEYVRLAWEVHNTEITTDQILTGLHSIGSEFTIDDAVKKIRKDNNSYDYWTEELRYLMFRYEEHLAKLEGQEFTSEEWNKIWMASPSKSIDHILAQNNAPEKVKHNIGNLVLLPLGLNAALQDCDFHIKRDSYIQTGLLITQKIANDHKHKRIWSERAIKDRQKELLNWIRIEWGEDR